MDEVLEQLTKEEREEVNIFIRSYLGCAKAGMVDDKWSVPQCLYGSILLTELFRLTGAQEKKG